MFCEADDIACSALPIIVAFHLSRGSPEIYGNSTAEIDRRSGLYGIFSRPKTRSKTWTKTGRVCLLNVFIVDLFF